MTGQSAQSGEPDPELDVTDLLDGRVRLLQPRTGWRVSMDSVLVAAATAVKPGQRVLDAGSGTGAVLLCLHARLGDGFTGVGMEIQPDYVALARRSAALTQGAERAEFRCGDLLRAEDRMELGARFDHIVSNPPYGAAGTASRLQARELAMRGSNAKPISMEVWIAACRAVLKPKGSMTMVQRADALDRVIAAFVQNGFGEIAVRPVRSHPSDPAVRILVSARLSVRSPARLCPDVILQDDQGGQSGEAVAVLRQGAALSMMG